jgi:hypothetical protein
VRGCLARLPAPLLGSHSAPFSTPKPTWIRALHSYCGSWWLQVSAQFVSVGWTPLVSVPPGHPRYHRRLEAAAASLPAHFSPFSVLCFVAGIVAWAMAYGIGANGKCGCLKRGFAAGVLQDQLVPSTRPCERFTGFNRTSLSEAAVLCASYYTLTGNSAAC